MKQISSCRWVPALVWFALLGAGCWDAVDRRASEGAASGRKADISLAAGSSAVGPPVARSPAALLSAAGPPAAERFTNGDLAARHPIRRVAVTFDDLPGTSPFDEECPADSILALNQRLLRHIEAYDVPAIGFVNEGHPCRAGGVLERVLIQWLNAGHTLGNHTYSHTDIDAVSLDAYITDLERGEPVTRRLLADRGEPLRYFRHPRLHAGADSAQWRGLRDYLNANEYVVAPVTIDNQEWIFDAVYRRAKLRGDETVMKRVAEAYAPYLSAVVAHFERWSSDVVGYEPPQILLLHVNHINADHFDRVAEMLQERGYTFISLEEALADPAYELEDGYVGPQGLSWVHRWAYGKGMAAVEGEPREPAWLADMYEAIP